MMKSTQRTLSSLRSSTIRSANKTFSSLSAINTITYKQFSRLLSSIITPHGKTGQLHNGLIDKGNKRIEQTDQQALSLSTEN